MKHFSHNSQSESGVIDSLIRPTWLSALIGGLISLSLITYVILSTYFKGSGFRFQLLGNSQAPATLNSVGQKLDSNSIISNLPLFLFWCLVGIVVYTFAVNIFDTIRHTAEVIDEFNNFVNIDRKQIIRAAIEKLIIRIFVILIWGAYILFFFHHLIPYVIVLSLASADRLLSLTGAGSFVLAAVVMFLALHVHTLLLRLLLLRTRVF